MSTILKTILIKLRNLIDRIIAKIDTPQPIHFPPLPEYDFTLTNCITSNSNISFNSTGLSGNNFVNCTCDGTATGINIYSDPK